MCGITSNVRDYTIFDCFAVIELEGCLKERTDLVALFLEAEEAKKDIQLWQGTLKKAKFSKEKNP